MAAPEQHLPCGLCGASAAPYTCPRCHRRLCSLRCYRAHGPCAEAFYRDQVLQELRGRRAAPRGVLPADPPADPEAAGLWQRLREPERREFLRLLSSGEAAALLPPWRPWWWRRRALVEPLGEEEEEDEEAQPGPAPPVPTSVPALSSLLSTAPSPLVRFQLPNALFGYAFALTLHGGDTSLVPELPGAAIAASAALRSGRPCPFSGTAEALRAALRDVKAAGLPPGPLGDGGTVLAVAELLEGRDPRDPSGDVAAALGHLRALLGAGARAVPPPERGPFRVAQRKVLFLLSWSRENRAQLATLAREVREVQAREFGGRPGGAWGVTEGSEGPWLIKEGGLGGPQGVTEGSGGPWLIKEGGLGGPQGVTEGSEGPWLIKEGGLGSPPRAKGGLGGPCLSTEGVLGAPQEVKEGVSGDPQSPPREGKVSGGPWWIKEVWGDPQVGREGVPGGPKGVPGGLQPPPGVAGGGQRLIEELD